MSELIYVACPYSHPDPQIRKERFDAVNRYAAMLMKGGKFIFSPISQNHPIAIESGLPTGWDFWEKYDTAILERCDKMIVLCLPGWEKSKGVAAEIAIARSLGLPIEYSYFEYVVDDNITSIIFKDALQRNIITHDEESSESTISNRLIGLLKTFLLRHHLEHIEILIVDNDEVADLICDVNVIHVTKNLLHNLAAELSEENIPALCNKKHFCIAVGKCGNAVLGVY